MIQHPTGNGHLPAKGTWHQAARTLPPEARVMGLYLLGASRSGKSRMLGRVLAWQDFLDEIGQVIFDPRGVTISNFLDKLLRFLQYVPEDQHARYWRRIRYVEVSGKGGHITGLPLYYRLTPEETLAEISERFLQLTLRSNPHMADAQYFGWPPFHRFGLNAGIICASLGRQVTDIESLISHPEQWLSRFAEAEARYPEARAACDFFRNEYLPMRPANRERLTNAFRDKIVQFTQDRLLALQFGGKAPPIDWEEVDAEGLTVLVDFSRETSTELRRFKMLWLFDYFFHWLKTRGRRSYPMSLLIDEFASMTHKEFSGENPFAVEMAEFIQEYLRNSNIWLTVAHQSIEQLDNQLRSIVFSLGTYLFGRATMPEARLLADYLQKRDPYLVKYWHRVWGHEPLFVSRGHNFGTSNVVIDLDPEFMNLEEQQELAARRIAELSRFQFLCRPALSEGEVSQSVIPISIAHVDRDEETGDYHFPNPQRIREVCSLLAAQPGLPMKTLLAEQDALAPTAQAVRQPKTPGTTPASQQSSAETAPTAHPPLPPRRQRLG